MLFTRCALAIVLFSVGCGDARVEPTLGTNPGGRTVAEVAADFSCGCPAGMILVCDVADYWSGAQDLCSPFPAGLSGGDVPESFDINNLFGDQGLASRCPTNEPIEDPVAYEAALRARLYCRGR